MKISGPSSPPRYTARFSRDLPRVVAARRLLAQLEAEDEIRAERERERAAAEAGQATPAVVLHQPDPVAYFRDVLGVIPWTRQEEILRAVATHPRVAVRSGHKIGKSNSAAGLALWWYEAHPRGLVVLTSATDFQVGQILWAELRRLVGGALRPIHGTLNRAHRTGLVADDGRKIIGVATNQTENMGGFSGPETLFIVDEASGVDETIFDAIEGNRAGGARVVMFGNPTQASGTFYDAFHDKADFWHGIHVSSEEAAEYQERVRVVPGLATRAWVEDKRLEWDGPKPGAPPGQANGPLWDIRVGGDFPGQGENVVIGLQLVEVAAKRGASMLPDGPLELGVDVAWYGDDESVIQPRRGRKALQPTALRSMDPVDVAGKVLEVVRQLRRLGERPRVKVDVIGIGAGVYAILARSNEVYAVAVNVAESATVKPGPDEPGYYRLRDQLWFGLAAWLKAGGGLPADPRLRAELVAPKYRFTPAGDYRVEGKDELKKRLKRSPDRADALCLSVYNPPGIGFALPDRIAPRRSLGARVDDDDDEAG